LREQTPRSASISTKQLGDALFGKLRLHGGKKGKDRRAGLSI